MSGILYIAGIVIIVVGAVAGWQTHSLWGFLLAFAGSVISAVLFFGLAKVLENQDTILYRLSQQDKTNNRAEPKVTCQKCGRQYLSTMSYCSYCGYRGNP